LPAGEILPSLLSGGDLGVGVIVVAKIEPLTLVEYG
jgi:hypothetical protein